MIIELTSNKEKLIEVIDNAAQGLAIHTEAYKQKAFKTIHEDTPIEKAIDMLVKNALENIDESEPEWTYLASRIYLQELYRQAGENRQYDGHAKYGDFYALLNMLTDKKIYKPTLLDTYTKEEIDYFAQQINAAKDLSFTYLGLYTLATRYLATDHDKNVFELPQERWMVIAMTLMQHEDKAHRTEHVLEAYWALSNLYMTVATPTLANAGKTHGQLSSCFIDTVDDSLQSIYDSNTDIAKLSKNGGGIGVYMGKIRSRGSSIKGFKGMSSGVVPWIKQLNNTAVNVDQLGTRKGAIAVYLDVWHRDIEAFLDLKLNNGDDRMRAHDIFTGVTLPDLFMEQVEKREDWYLFDPHEVRQVMGYSLEDFYDEAKGNGTWREKYQECVESDQLTKRKIPAIDIMKRIMKSQLESGTPFMFYRDEVNRQNSNSHNGMIYCSNLCTEITQNQSPSEFMEEFLEGESTIVKKYQSGDYVVCNLSSINLGKAVPDEILERLIKIQVRMLDNVIDINNLPIMQAQLTNKKYRAIGLGTFGWHHLLARKNLQWETDEAVNYANDLYEKIAFLTIKSSMELSKEKGSYPAYEGSKWSSGEYFDLKGYHKGEWLTLKEAVKEHGMRNGYLMAVAPNSTTAMIAGSTASIDPIFKPFYNEEKKDFKIPVTAPDLTHETYNVYRRSAYIVDQRWSVKQNAARQKHIDQSLSFNFYVPNTIRASVLLDLHLQAWREGLKTTYYVRSTSSEVEECEWCQS
ncbi:MAG: ribonucleoside-diphosphate reductase subunit alpha [Bacillota bacterium]|uniref:Ribonucleoside-diphosphate reductase n=1 Tax=Virgibacillus salarius TaxID=447199 RepID=A0A941E382_9BACI|nr:MULTISPECIES: ribonucleoside-diphosphate reductase subunit alpha [Bacillaceae]MBR7798023.1 ribonucleoside-diphosphate reductase subunit alpha [Virgibacillus salarius]MDY7045964.1 ribonucleoside-diphosphate reductase subunit alpha [Virgibacillus sp. M23]NAZ10732.1 ribonucleoside-diphosphate reductase subunit alpha [Agaribacter marinus]